MVAFEANPLWTAAQVIIRNPLSAAFLVYGHCVERSRVTMTDRLTINRHLPMDLLSSGERQLWSSGCFIARRLPLPARRADSLVLHECYKETANWNQNIYREKGFFSPFFKKLGNTASRTSVRWSILHLHWWEQSAGVISRNHTAPWLMSFHSCVQSATRLLRVYD